MGQFPGKSESIPLDHNINIQTGLTQQKVAHNTADKIHARTRPVRLRADGFLDGAKSALALPERQAAREWVYRLLREAGRLEETSAPASVLETVQRARREAERVGDRYLESWVRRREVTALVRARRYEEAE